MEYLQTAPGPLSQVPLPYSPADIPPLMEALRKYGLTKGELMMLVNTRTCDRPGRTRLREILRLDRG